MFLLTRCLNSFNLSRTFLGKDIYFEHVLQACQHSRGRRVPGGCASSAAVMRARGQVCSDERTAGGDSVATPLRNFG